jgi:glycosyltransferase involved in cell wall biosynthesis
MNAGGSLLIVCRGGMWDGLVSRRQHFMRRLAALGHRVIFVEPSQSSGRLFSGSRVNPVTGHRVRTVEHGIRVITPPLALPFRHSGPGRKLNARREASAIRSELRRTGETGIDLLWVYEPRFTDTMEHLSFSGLVFDMVDDYLAPDYGGANLERGTGELLSGADLSIFTTRSLFDRYAPGSARSCIVPNGYDHEVFVPSGIPRPADMPEFGGPVACMTGTLFHHLDFGVLSGVAGSLAEMGGGLVLVGPVESGDDPELQSLLGMDNVILVGPRPYGEVPGYVLNSDLCVAAFRKGRVGRSVSPLKLYEYLGCGRPVIVSGLASFRDDPLHRFVYDLDSVPLDQALERCLEESPSMSSRRVSAAVETSSWDARFRQLRPHLGFMLEPDGAAP